jgi:VIT1/CCC1 family predicted Fe2+/Mn2+ transporter
VAYFPLLPGLAPVDRRALSTVLCAVSFWVLGAVRARMSEASVFWTALTMALTGSAAALTSFLASKLIYWMLVGGDPPAGG